jgi:hypothetical protein
MLKNESSIGHPKQGKEVKTSEDKESQQQEKHRL